MEDELLKKFAERLINLREAKGLTQEQLALKSNLDRTYIGRIERQERNPSLRSLYKISVALNISLSELVDLEIKSV